MATAFVCQLPLSSNGSCLQRPVSATSSRVPAFRRLLRRSRCGFLSCPPAPTCARRRRGTVRALLEASTESANPAGAAVIVESDRAAGNISVAEEAARTSDTGLARACAEVPATDRKRRRKVSFIGVLFLAITYVWGCLHFVPVLLAHPFVLLLDGARRRFSQACGMSWLRTSLASVGISPELVGVHNLRPEGEPVVYVANHASNMDIYVLPYLGRSLKVVAKAEIFKMPVIGWAMRMAGNIGVRRTDRRGQMEAFRSMVTVLRRGLSLVVYPEGTRSESGRMASFKAGAFRAAKEAGVPIIPVTITGTREMMPSYAYVPLQYPPSPLRLTIHPAIDSIGRSVDELRDLAFRAVESVLEPSIQTLAHDNSDGEPGDSSLACANDSLAS